MKTTVTKQQIILLTVLCFILVGLVMVMYVLTPMWEAQEDLDMQITDAQTEYDRIHLASIRADQYETTIAALQAEIEQSTDFLYPLATNNEGNTKMLTAMIQDCGGKVASIVIADPISLEESSYIVAETTSAETTANTASDASSNTTATDTESKPNYKTGIMLSTADISAELTYSQLLSLIKSANNDKALMISKIAFSQSVSEQTTNGVQEIINGNTSAQTSSSINLSEVLSVTISAVIFMK